MLQLEPGEGSSLGNVEVPWAGGIVSEARPQVSSSFCCFSIPLYPSRCPLQGMSWKLSVLTVAFHLSLAFPYALNCPDMHPMNSSSHLKLI